MNYEVIGALNSPYYRVIPHFTTLIKYIIKLGYIYKVGLKFLGAYTSLWLTFYVRPTMFDNFLAQLWKVFKVGIERPGAVTKY